MATRQQEKYLDHTRCVYTATCRACGREWSSPDEMELVDKIMENGWTPVDKGLYCEECSTKYKPKLEPGYYWVKITLDGKEQQYIGHHWGDGDWDVFGMDYKYGPDDFSEIGPRITPPAN